MDDAATVGELQTTARLDGDIDSLFQRQPVPLGIFYDTFHVAAAHKLGDHVGLAWACPEAVEGFLTQIKDGDYVRMR